MALSATLVLSACVGDSTGPADVAIAPFVGDWRGDVFVVTSVANPDVHLDLIQLGATFTLNVQDSGHYTAILIFRGQTSTEFGTAEISGNTITLRRDFPTVSTSSSTFAFQGPNWFEMDGDSQFDFNLDGEREPARAHVEFERK